MTANNHKSLVVLFVIVILSALLSACNGNNNTQAQPAGERLASSNNVLASNRIDACRKDFSTMTLIKGRINDDIAAASKAAGKQVTQLDITTDEWINGRLNDMGYCVDVPVEQ